MGVEVGGLKQNINLQMNVSDYAKENHKIPLCFTQAALNPIKEHEL